MRHLFVGGPHDGQVHWVEGEPELYRLANNHSDEVLDFMSGPCAAPDQTFSTYRRTDFYGAGGVYLNTRYVHVKC